MKDQDIIKSLVKSIDVLKLVKSKDGISINMLHSITSIPKPTLCRILNTLEYCNLVHKSLIDKLYRDSNNIEPSNNRVTKGLIASVAGEILDDLCNRLLWPSDFLIQEGIYMRVVETTRVKSPLSVNKNSYGDRINILFSAVGRAYLSYCSHDERIELINSLTKSSNPHYYHAKDKAWIERIINKTIKDGYGTRDNDFFSIKKGDEKIHDGLSAIAVPVIINGNIEGCINMLWPSRLYSCFDFAKMHLKDLSVAAKEIERATKLVLECTP